MGIDKIGLVIALIILFVHNVYKIQFGMYDKKRNIRYNKTLKRIDSLYSLSFILLILSLIFSYSQIRLNYLWIGDSLAALVFFLWSYIYWKSRLVVRGILEEMGVEEKALSMKLDSFNFIGKMGISLIFLVVMVFSTIYDIIIKFFR